MSRASRRISRLRLVTIAVGFAVVVGMVGMHAVGSHATAASVAMASTAMASVVADAPSPGAPVADVDDHTSMDATAECGDNCHPVCEGLAVMCVTAQRAGDIPVASLGVSQVVIDLAARSIQPIHSDRLSAPTPRPSLHVLSISRT